MMLLKSRFIAFFTFLLISSSAAYAQEEEAPIDNSLNGEFSSIMENSETFQRYKVVPITTLNSFWGKVQDSLAQYKNQIDVNQQKFEAEVEKVDTLKNTISSLESQLAESETLNNSIEFLGITVTKVVYNIIVWAIIIVLLVGCILLYLSFKNSHRVTKNTKRDYDNVQEELEEMRKTAQEKQIKLKRELQTALNKLDELNR
jgi:peptidoglycan hydrolase CwlO-like protein